MKERVHGALRDPAELVDPIGASAPAENTQNPEDLQRQWRALSTATIRSSFPSGRLPLAGPNKEELVKSKRDPKTSLEHLRFPRSRVPERVEFIQAY